MKLLQRCDHRLQAEHYANVLRAAGIACQVRNTTLSGAIGEIPFLECAPQLWVDSALDEARAAQIIGSLQRPVDGPSWHCACGETIEPQFGQCWHCGATPPIDIR
ncbi:MAG: DUF2007 domain-containing protein [Burkholderiaceae bacterium]|jgi:hypothetical protein|nr:DUF2007 domain-containing protein [Burkholderiaceae bacterium]